MECRPRESAPDQGGVIPRRWWLSSRLRQRTREGGRGLFTAWKEASMSDIAPVSNSSLIGAISANEARARKAEQLESTDVARSREADAVEISPFARYVAMARENPVREDLIESIRQQIADGTYDTDDKFDRAFDEMLSDLR